MDQDRETKYPVHEAARLGRSKCSVSLFFCLSVFLSFCHSLTTFQDDEATMIKHDKSDLR